ncbi:MAG: outer membrane lipoprotein carrier protein LolA [Bacteroidales bacterium]|jgi:outer membrane lipoprotein-sorting protein|nr:outer membrane lipoprotein carrier protein LolA [Bacteroidales bacterium]
MSQKRVLHASLFAFLFLFSAYGQDDSRSQKIIDDMAAKFKSYRSVSLKFSVIITQLQDKSETEQEGKIWVKGDKYKLEAPDYTLYFDGSKVYQYLPGAREVNITKPDPDETDEDFRLLNPQTYFHLSSKSFKSRLIKESIRDNRKAYEIDLYPIQLKTTKYSRIRMMVEKSTLQLVHLKVFLKDGSQYALSFKPYDVLQTALRDSFFTFNTIEHPDVEVIDLTF